MIRKIIGVGMDPLEAGRIVLAGVRSNDLWIFSHPEFGPGMRERVEALMASVPHTQAPQSRLGSETTTLHNSLYVRERAKKLGARRKA